MNEKQAKVLSFLQLTTKKEKRAWYAYNQEQKATTRKLAENTKQMLRDQKSAGE